MTGPMLFYMLIVIILVIVGVVLAMVTRQWATQDDELGEVFTLQDLREMRERGDISEVEFRSMRGELLGRFADNNPANRDVDPN